MAEPVLSLEDAGVRLDGRWIWRHVDLRIAAGDFVAVLGPNGAGKSTLLRALLGLQPLTEGGVTVLGGPVHRGNRLVGYLPQRRRFDPDLRIRTADVVRFGVDGERWGLPLPGAAGGRRGREAARRVVEVLDLVGAGALANRPIGELSGGEQQRVLIAQALAGGARMLLLDEPLDSLDLPNQTAIAGLVRDICRDRGVTVLLVAHDVNPILPHLDRVAYVAAGAVIEGAPEDVIQTDTLTRLYGAPVEVLRTRDGRVLVVGQQEAVSYHGHQH